MAATKSRSRFEIFRFSRSDTFVLVLSVALLSVSLYFRSTDSTLPANRLRDFETLMHRSGSIDAADYFNNLSKLWYPVISTMDPQDFGDINGDLTYKAVANKKFTLILTGHIGGAIDTTDLGVIGRNKAIISISALVWACSDTIVNVDNIVVNLVETDSWGRSAVYKARLSPNTCCAHPWKTYSEPELIKLIKEDMVVIDDTASGRHMLYRGSR